MRLWIPYTLFQRCGGRFYRGPCGKGSQIRHLDQHRRPRSWSAGDGCLGSPAAGPEHCRRRPSSWGPGNKRQWSNRRHLKSGVWAPSTLKRKAGTEGPAVGARGISAEDQLARG